MRRPRWSTPAVALLAGVFLLPAMAVAAPETTEICHFNADDDPGVPDWELLEVNARSVGSHLSHGDGFPGGEVPGTEGSFVFDSNCVPQEVQTEMIFAVAYVDSDPNDGGYTDGDILIAKLVDGPGAANDGLAGPGDVVVTGAYPDSFAATTTIAFRDTSHTVDSVLDANPLTCVVANTEGHQIGWGSSTAAEGYSEIDFDQLAIAAFQDAFVQDQIVQDVLFVTLQAPSDPPTAVGLLSASDPSDQAFIDVEVNCAPDG